MDINEDDLKETMISTSIFDANDNITFRESNYAGGIEVSNGGEKYLVFNDRFYVVEAAEHNVRGMIETGGIGMISPDFVREFVYITETDIDMIADEEAQSLAEGTDEADILREMDVSEEDIENGNYDIDQLRSGFAEVKAEEIRDAIQNPIQYFVKDQGMYTEEDLLKQPFIRYDIEKICEEAVFTAGVAHFLAGYDGDEVEFEDRNGVRYWAYRTN